MTCPRCGGEAVNKNSEVLNDPKLGKVIFRKTSCAACGFYTVNTAWVNEKEEVEYCGWTQADDVPPHVPDIVKLERSRLA